ncbi:ABC transporter ATP-binding protein [Kitasatospora sp. HPMI-4]
MEVGAGEVFGLIGPNGAGKTTTLECLVGLRRPTAGLIRVLGLDPADRSPELRRQVAVQPQEGTLFPQLRARETIELWASFYFRPLAVDQVLKDVGLVEQAEQKVKALSGGQRRRLLLAISIVGRPKLLVLDEPAAGLDPQARELLWDVVRAHRRAGGSVLLTTHDMNEAAQLCDRIGVLVSGRIVASGTSAELVRELGGLSTVSFTTDAPAVLASVRRLPGVSAVRTESARGRVLVQVSTEDGDAVLKHVASTPALNATDLSVTHGGLDEVFRNLVASACKDNGGEEDGSADESS